MEDPMQRKKLFFLTVFLFLAAGAVFLWGEGIKEEPVQGNVVKETRSVTVIDSAGNEISVNKPLERIVVAYYGCAEVMRSLNAEDKIVGVGKTVTARPDYFPRLSGLPSTGNTTFNEAEQILNLYPDAVIIGTGSRNNETREKLLAVNPDLIVIQMAFYKPEYHVEEIEKLGLLLNKEEEARAYLDFYDKVITTIGSRVASIPPEEHPKVYLESTQDFKTGAPGSSWHPKIIAAGGFNIYGDEDIPLPKVSAESVVEKNPDIIVKVSGWNMANFGGYGVTSYDEMIAVRESIEDRPAWNNISAVQNGRVWIMYNDLLGGPGYFVGMAYLAKIINPGLFNDVDPQKIHQEYLTRFQRLDFDVQREGVFIYPSL